MPKASVSRLIERDKTKLINFVLDIEKYPEFIPFCIDSKVYEKKEDDEVVNIIMTKSFEFGLNKIADAFQKRAETI